MTVTTTTAAIVSDRKQVIRQAEFSLVDFAPNENAEAIAAGRLRFPPGCARSAIRELIALLRQRQTTILSQQCVGDATATTGWSSLIFAAPVRTYQQLIQTARSSNLQVVRDSTEVLLQQLLAASVEETLPLVAAEVELGDDNSSTVELAEWLVLSDATVAALDSNARVELTSTEENCSSTVATPEQLNALTLTKLKELASLHNVQGRSTLTKNLEIARQKLVPKLVGLVTVAEL